MWEWSVAANERLHESQHAGERVALEDSLSEWSVPPAYGVWKQIDPRTFETKYVFYTTKEPGPGDGQTYASTIRLATYDRTGTPIACGGEGTGAGTRIVF